MLLKYESFADLYKNSIDRLGAIDATVSPRGQMVYEEIGCAMALSNPTLNLFENPIRSCPLNYLKSELTLYFNGVDDVESFSKASAFWSKLATDGRVNSAYGQLIFKKKNKFGKTQLQWVLDSFVKDIDTRQAIMYLGGSDYQYDGNPDFVCTSTYQFFIREDKLHMVVNRRSQDIFYGLTYDLPWECALMDMLSVKMSRLLNKQIGHGQYTLMIGSFHMYDRNKEILTKMSNSSWTTNSIPRQRYEVVDDIGNITDWNVDDEFVNWLKAGAK